MSVGDISRAWSGGFPYFLKKKKVQENKSQINLDRCIKNTFYW